MRRSILFALLALTGCLKPDGTGPASSDSKTRIEDTNLLAGTSSSTNWPEGDDGGTIPITVSGRADSELVIYFRKLVTPVKLTGSLTFFRGGAIPALETSVSTSSFKFMSQDSVKIPAAVFSSVAEQDQDTVRFSMRVEIDTLQCFILGFSHSRIHKRIIASPFSVLSAAPIPLTKPDRYINGVADTSLINSGASEPGISKWCFYIPGSPYFWMTGIDTSISIGPLPMGSYPVRLLKLIRTDSDQKKSHLEVYEVIQKKIPVDALNHKAYYTFGIGEKILEVDSPDSFSILSESP